jgi:UPF0716 protein FxsA
MSLRAFVVFVVAPAVEIFVFVEVARWIGLGWALLAIVAFAALGAYVMKLAGAAGWRALSGRVDIDPAAGAGPSGAGASGTVVTGRPDGAAAADAALLFLAGLLLFLPGFVSDVVGLVLLLPVVRHLVRGATVTWLARRFTAVDGPGGVRLWVRNGSVVRGQVVRDDGGPGSTGPGGTGGMSPGQPPHPLPPAD